MTGFSEYLPMKILGISSATSTLSVGLIDNDNILAEYTLAGEDVANLTVLIDRILKEAKLSASDIEGVAVTQGPGSYTGLRGGLATAKSLSQVLNCKLVGVSSLEAMAYNLMDVEGTIVVAVHACRDEMNLALFGASGSKLKRLTDDFVVKTDKIGEVLLKVRGLLYLLTDRPQIYEKIRESNPQTKIQLVEPLQAQVRGVNVACLGLEYFQSEVQHDFMSLTPHYSHQPNLKEYKTKEPKN